MEDSTVTLRDRDSLEQTRVAAEELPDLLAEKLAAPWTTPKLA
jgi:glycyl-tRNA synthetase